LSLCLCVVLPCVGRGLHDELITRRKESYHVSNNIRETSQRKPLLYPGWSAIGKNASVKQNSDSEIATYICLKSDHGS
jgi:hypothetical protein